MDINKIIARFHTDRYRGSSPYANFITAVFQNFLVIFAYAIFGYSVVSIKRTGSLNYFEDFYHPELFFSCTK